METPLLSKHVQEYLKEHLKSDIAQLSLKGSPFKDLSTVALMQQLVGLKKSKNKLPTWHHTEGILFPPKLNLEQTSSEATANYKASLLNGNKIIDITGGFGVDSYAFSKHFANVVHCEKNASLIRLAQHNAQVLDAQITFIEGDGLSYLKKESQNYDCIYIDPSRRHDVKGKVFLLEDCEPNIPQHLQFLFTKTSHILVKTSPLLDITSGIRELAHVKEIHCVAVNNDVKELLWILTKEIDKNNNPTITAINLREDDNAIFKAEYNKVYTASFSTPKQYLYEPNAALMKSGLFDAISEVYNIQKLHQHTHLYTSSTLINFPGRRFRINEVIPYNKKGLKKAFKNEQANVNARHFPMTVAQLKQQFKIRDGGHTFLFFTTTLDGAKVCLHCSKV